MLLRKLASFFNEKWKRRVNTGRMSWLLKRQVGLFAVCLENIIH